MYREQNLFSSFTFICKIGTFSVKWAASVALSKCKTGGLFSTKASTYACCHVEISSLCSVLSKISSCASCFSLLLRLLYKLVLYLRGWIYPWNSVYFYWQIYCAFKGFKWMLIYTIRSRILSWRLFFFARCQISQQSECSSVCASMNSVSFLGLCWCFSLRLLFCFPFHHIDSFKGNRRGRGAVAASRCSFPVWPRLY